MTSSRPIGFGSQIAVLSLVIQRLLQDHWDRLSLESQSKVHENLAKWVEKGRPTNYVGDEKTEMGHEGAK